MIELERHIEILLLSNDCVIVPDLGGFMAHHIDARYDEGDGMFVPPIRTLGFNPQLKMNDSLLVQSYIEAYDISYPEALRRIEGEVEELRGHLEANGYYELNDIGTLRVNEEGKLEFEPCEAGILTPDLYGFGSFEMKPLAQLFAEEAAGKPASTARTDDDEAITIKMSWLRNAVAVAAAVIAFFMIGTPVSNSEKTTDVQQSSFINVKPTHPAKAEPSGTAMVPGVASTAGEATVATEKTETAGQPSVADAQEVTAHGYCIVMASQVSEKNANIFISQLSDKGFSDARILLSGKKKIRRVVYGNFETESDAANTLHELRKESRLFKDTWIMEI